MKYCDSLDIQQQGPSIERDKVSIDWIFCSLRHTSTKDTLLPINLKQFSEINALPCDLDITLLNDGSGIEATLRKK